MDKRSDAIETVVDVFNEAMVIQELYLKKSKFKELSMSETHVLDAVDKVEFPSMTNVAKSLSVTMGTLTTAVKKIVEKGFLVKERSINESKTFFCVKPFHFSLHLIHPFNNMVNVSILLLFSKMNSFHSTKFANIRILFYFDRTVVASSINSIIKVDICSIFI